MTLTIEAALVASELDVQVPLAYGTAGFRTSAELLPVALRRLGLLAAARSRALGGKTIGVMITASHNPPGDNGVKLVDPLGEMLEASWESHATAIVNASGGMAGASALLSSLNLPLAADRASVVYAIDTRASGPALAACLRAGLECAGDVDTIDGGMLTTPQLHYLVRAHNDSHFGAPSIDGYNQKIDTALRKLGLSSIPRVTVDCANGVGAIALENLRATSVVVQQSTVVVNSLTNKPEQLNVDCGADYVKVQQRAPAGVALEKDSLYASFDGDADRVVLYYADASGQFKLLDGDKIAGLLAACFANELKAANLFDSIRLGVVQTAYANGAAVQYVRSLGLPAVCASTGVKYLHHEALKFDIGVYFEANGHGTVVFSNRAVSLLQEVAEVSNSSSTASAAASRILALRSLINECVGDAIADLIAVQAVLQLTSTSPSQWDATWEMLPNRLLKRAVRDRHAFSTTDAERRLVSPEGLQSKIDQAVAAVPSGRSFVRASGTENVVRVYAEAATAKDADTLGQNVLALLDPFA